MTDITSQLAWISQFHSSQPHLGLERVQQVLAYLGNPHQQLKVIHIGGTNGKGSTITMLTQMLQKAGLNVGVFSSPHILAFNEQLQINGQMISGSALADLLAHIQGQCQTHLNDPQLAGLTEFEVMTAAAFYYFGQAQVDVAIFEVGLGGDLDATNVCLPMLTGITTIGLDHVAILGDNLAEIATHKAGIIKEGIPIVTGQIGAEALDVIEEVAHLHQAPMWQSQVAYHFDVDQQEGHSVQGHTFTYSSQLRPTSHFKLGLLGQHQVENGAMALTLMDLFCQIEGVELLSQDQVNQAFQAATWPGRLEIIRQEPLIILDGAHNHHAMARLIKNMNQDFAKYHKTILFACIQTKDLATMVADLQEIEQAHIYLTSFADERAVTADLMATQALPYQSDWKAFIDSYLSKPHSKSDLLLITGSLYFISQVRPHLLNNV